MQRNKFNKGEKVIHLPTKEELTVISSLTSTINSKEFISCRKKDKSIEDYCVYYLERK